MASAVTTFSYRFKPRWRFMHEIRNSGKVLELGCGSGVNFRNMKLLGGTAEFHGIDIMPPAAIDPQIVYHRVNLDIEQIPYPDASFDATLFTHVFEHLREPLAVCS